MKLAKSFWILSLFIFLGVSLFIYGDVGASIKIGADGTFVMEKTQFFYATFGVMMIINVLLLLGSYSVPYLPPAVLFVPKKEIWLTSKESRRKFYTRFKLWVKGLGAIMNAFLLSSVLVVYYMNSTDYFPMSWIFYILGAFTIIWMMLYYPIFSQGADNIDDL